MWLIVGSFSLNSGVAWAQSLKIVYPPVNHQTTSESIFIIGSAPSSGKVIVNGKQIKRSQKGNFAPTIPLSLGKNEIVIRYGQEKIKRTIIRKDNQPPTKELNNLSPNLLTPNTSISRLPKELICFTAVTPNSASTSVKIANKTIALTPEISPVKLPPNSSVLIAKNQPQQTVNPSWQKVSGCTSFSNQINNLQPVFTMKHQGQTIVQKMENNINILNPERLTVIEVISEQGVARTGPSTNYSRLTPLPQGTRATVTGRQGEWLRLDYGGWIKEKETKVLPTYTPPTSVIRSVTSRQISLSSQQSINATEVIFPLENPVPITIKQDDNSFTLSLHNTIAQTDTIRFNDNPLIKRLDWYQATPKRIDYIFHFKSPQQWGYEVRYEGNSLILTFNHKPQNISGDRLDGISILLDPGHGGDEFGAVGPTGYPEKDVNLVVSKLLAKELQQKGAKVYLTRENDKFVSLGDRQKND